MDATRVEILYHLGGALAAGSLVGIERSWHGRPAGFRTHALVCTASAMLMTLSVYESLWFPRALADAARLDPTRMAQGIVTGIGFLGAGAIFKEGLTVRGLTTAASIWITAAIGILMGVGLFFAGAVSTGITLGVLVAFRWLERLVPVEQYIHHAVRFLREEAPPEARLRALLAEQECKISDLSQHLVDDGRILEYRMVLKARKAGALSGVAGVWLADPRVRGFSLTPSAT